MPPPKWAELPVRAQPLTVIDRPKFWMPPPPLTAAELPDRTQPLTVNRPGLVWLSKGSPLRMPPPAEPTGKRLIAELPVRTQPLIVDIPVPELWMPPPNAAALPDRVQPLTIS